MTKEEYNEIIQSLKEGSFQLNDNETLNLINIYLANEIGFKEYIVNNYPNSYNSIENFLLRIIN